MIEAEERYERKRLPVLGKVLAYVDEGSGDPIVFLHGNPASSYVWRNILPFLTMYGRCIAPDLVGMGRSQKISPSADRTYRFDDFQYYLYGLLNAIGVTQNVTFVVHGWGAALGIEWARRHPGATKAIAYTESIIRPLSWEEWPSDTRATVRALRGPGGMTMALTENLVVEQLLPATVSRSLSSREMEEYRSPFRLPGEGRRPTLSCIRDLPIGGEPEDTVKIVRDNAEWLADSDIPKLFVNCDPGYVLVGEQREDCRRFKAQTEIMVSARHYPQEDSPMRLAAGLVNWYRSL